MTMSPNRNVVIRIVEDWTEEFLDKLATFAKARSEITPWQNRWLAEADYYRWKCANNPAAQSVGAFAFDRDDLVGSAIVTFKWARYDGARSLVGEIGDLYVSEGYRRQGIFRNLVAAATERAAERGAELIYCVPNHGGHNALLKTGIYEDVPTAQHRTWLLPLKPLTFAGTRLATAKKLAWIDPILSSALRTFIGRKRGAALVCPEELLGDLHCETEATSFRVEMTQDFFQYRILAHPSRETYFALRNPPTSDEGAGGIVKKTSYCGNTAFLLARVMSSNSSSLVGILRTAVGAIESQDAAFLALWAPANGPIATTLRRNLFVPVQTKSIALACYTPPHLRSRFGHLHIDMLDSDKA